MSVKSAIQPNPERSVIAVPGLRSASEECNRKDAKIVMTVTGVEKDIGYHLNQHNGTALKTSTIYFVLRVELQYTRDKYYSICLC